MLNVPTGSETGSEWRTILGLPQLIECMGICVMSLAHGSELRSSDVYLHIVTFFFKLSHGYVPLDGLCLERFLGIFFGMSARQMI